MKFQAFKWLSLLTGLLYLWLFYQLLFTPAEMLRSFGVGVDGHTVHLAQRISGLMLGFAVLLFLGAPLGQSKVRAIIASAIAVNMLGFALNSFWGAAHGILTETTIPLIGAIETLIGLSYAIIAVSDFLKTRAAR